MKNKYAIILALLILLSIAIGCSKTGPPINPKTNEIIIQNFAFTPDTITIQKGTTVTWTNQDTALHAIKTGTTESPKLNKGESYSQAFDNTGAYEYYCSIHPTMKGQVIVQ